MIGNYGVRGNVRKIALTGTTGKGTTSVVPLMASRSAALAAEGFPRVRFVL